MTEHRLNFNCIDHTTAANARDDRESLAHDRSVELDGSALGRQCQSAADHSGRSAAAETAVSHD